MSTGITDPTLEAVYNTIIVNSAKVSMGSGAGGRGLLMLVEPIQCPYSVCVLSQFSVQLSTCSFTDTDTQLWGEI